MNNPFELKNEYCEVCKKYNKIIKDYADNFNETEILNISVGLGAIVDVIIEETKGKKVDCNEDACSAVLNVYDEENLTKMKKTLDNASKNSDFENAIKMIRNLKIKYNEMGDGDL